MSTLRFMNVARDLIATALDAIEKDPEIQRRLRDVIRLLASPTTPHDAEFERVAEFAKRVALSERTIWKFVKSGMPTIGVGRARRIDVARAVEWLRRHREQRDVVVELEARRRARAASQRRNLK